MAAHHANERSARPVAEESLKDSYFGQMKRR
jgi:hypothetical protein